MNNDVLVNVENVSKRFCRSLKRSLWYGTQDLASELGGRRHGGGTGLPQSSADVKLRADEFWAVRDVSFDLRRGECLGLIGRNGAGKTTLLRMLNGLIKPDTGQITIKGNVGALIALGTGFNPVLTGRENILISTSILGISGKLLSIKMEDIIEFSELREFIDTPVQAYSSGMQVRLGFAVAQSIEPDILLLDEVLAVGDASFRAKCYTRIGDLAKKCALILVSHDSNAMGQICSQGVVLRQGEMLSDGPTSIDEALNIYYTKIDSPSSQIQTTREPHICQPLLSCSVSITPTTLSQNDEISIAFCGLLLESETNILIRATIFDNKDLPVLEWNSRNANGKATIDLSKGENQINVIIKNINLKRGFYYLSFLISDSTGLRMLYLNHKGFLLEVEGNVFGQAPVQVDGQITHSHVFTSP
jgi:lipopolysaccharide transport system ATP-binding protein